jgi:hypothetical protein
LSGKRKWQFRIHPVKTSTVRKKRYKISPGVNRVEWKPSNITGSLKTLARDLSTTISKVTKKIAGEDYNSIVKSFIPAGANTVVPQYPVNSERFQFADLDGDSKDELITSYKLGDELKTIILKKENERWHKAAEVSSTDYATLNYRNTADIKGEGKKHLVIGMTSKGKTPTLFGYSLEKGSMNKIFTRNYHIVEVLKPPKTRNGTAKTQLAVWNRKEDDGYSIEVLNWNGSQFEQLKNRAPYYQKSVVPYYAQRVNLSPYSPSNWYNLADALAEAGMSRDALTAVEVGTAQDRNSAYKEKFAALKNKITAE